VGAKCTGRDFRVSLTPQQHDVGWTQRLPNILHAFGAGQHERELDLVCDDPSQMSPEWFHFKERLPLMDEPVFSCLLPVVRASTRLLRHLVELVSVGNETVYCEIRAPTACARASWCSMGSIRGDRAPLLAPFSHFTYVPSRFLEPPPQGTERSAKRASIAAAGCVGRLVHQVV